MQLKETIKKKPSYNIIYSLYVNIFGKVLAVWSIARTGVINCQNIQLYALFGVNKATYFQKSPCVTFDNRHCSKHWRKFLFRFVINWFVSCKRCMYMYVVWYCWFVCSYRVYNLTHRVESSTRHSMDPCVNDHIWMGNVF